MIVVTGAAGFIGSCVVSRLNKAGIEDIIAVDVLRENDKWKNLRNLRFHDYLDRDQLFEYLKFPKSVHAIIHMGACSSTTERNSAYLMENNYRYSLQLIEYALMNDIRFIYASSAATYGAGEQGYDDDEDKVPGLKPLNMYGYSKQVLDLKVLREKWSDKAAGLKFFNVYGPNEYHKGDMSSVVYKAFNQIRTSGSVKLFKSHNPDYLDGEQLRDFVYVKDVVEIIYHLLQKKEINGIFNIGSGKARSFKDLATATFNAMNVPVNIQYIDMPESIRDRYQYFTEAKMDKLIRNGIQHTMMDLEAGITDYVRNYLEQGYGHY
jgi:ADP-L-glycero-D-manno-heptose 6-epimerase